MKRRNFLAAMGAAFVAGCSKIGDSELFGSVVDTAESWHRGIHRALGMGRITMAPEFTRADISPFFRGNGSTNVETPEYAEALAGGFAQWQLAVTGLVDNPLSLSMDDIRALPQRTQITRHDCVEGWSAIGEWTGPQLSAILDMAGVEDGANFAIFHCADKLSGADYYESCDMDDARHPQTIVAHLLNGERLPVINGAPLRMRIERQLGYKHPKYLTGIELVSSLEQVGDGKGGYWEDRAGYQWYAGI
ncbi:molybdopterin-binding protein [Alteraurantiacibacter aestuarii]|uniref:Molybdopterin-dependent oxidoreductase n=1 Tax=Alteraurantiacibacter aestuarii TaxID=650004 RepID=A0A844ZKH5_9SPHN|nr:molybdopterin-dependent oxidoreductase [Alteraurantiacibacter aestuarii]MXO87762.1 molybdopterin-dependent oxidoreductase [Alteraurantiacibacter aestuarii]